MRKVPELYGRTAQDSLDRFF
jgi:hypothetical protein